MKSINKTNILTLSALSIAVNVVLGTIISMTNIPLLFLDTIGTVFIAVLFGPLYGAGVGILTNVITAITVGSPLNIFFGLVSVAIAVVVGLAAKKYDFRKWYIALSTGLVISVVAPLIGTPIAVAIFGGLNGSGADLIVLWLRSTGESVFASTFISRISSNIVDKVVTCLLVAFLIMKLPMFNNILVKRYEKK